MGSAYSDLLTHPPVAGLFEPAVVMQAMLDVERALVLEQAACGLVPLAQAQVVADCCVLPSGQADALVRDAAQAGSLAIPLVNHLRAQVAARDATALAAVHVGATSQDLIDTVLSIQGRAALDLIDEQAGRVLAAIVALQDQHGDQPMLARTLMQPAAVATLDLRLLNWALPLQRCRSELRRHRREALTLQLAGPIGTAGAWGEKAQALRLGVARRLGLDLQPWVWQVQRDSMARLAAELGVLVGALGKVATDVMLMAQAEVGELTESAAPGRGGSSAMPHKRNPVGSMVALTALQRAPQRVAVVLSAMAQPYERAAGAWQAEGAELCELFTMAAAAAAAMAQALEGAQVHPEQLHAHVKAFAAAQPDSAASADALTESRAALWAQLRRDLAGSG